MGRTVPFGFARHYAQLLADNPEQAQFSISRDHLQEIVDSEAWLEREYPPKVPLEEQLQDLRKVYPDAAIGREVDNSGSRLLSVPGVKLPRAWEPKETTIYIVIPKYFPINQPQRFYTPPNVRLRGGAYPTNTLDIAEPRGGPLVRGLMWWHWAIARPSSRHSLRQYVNAMRQRFAVER